MSDCNCENDSDGSAEQTFEAYMRAGELAVKVESASSKEAHSRAKAMWDKVVEDVEGMSEEERRNVSLK